VTGRDVLLSGVGEDSILGQVLRPMQRTGVARLESVADDVYALQPDRRVISSALNARRSPAGSGRRCVRAMNAAHMFD
jgi:hypothetical protein